MLSYYGVPLLLRLHRYVCAWTRLFYGDCACTPATTESYDNTPEETTLQKLR